MSVKPSVVAVSVGRPAELPYRSGTVRTAFIKHVRQGAVHVGPLGLEGDEQGDPERHGGPDKAVLVYAVEHYPYWRSRLERDVAIPGFGENLTVRGLTEWDACIGDVLQIGDVVAEVAQARQPCFKIAARYKLPKIAKWVQDEGRTGYYLRVLRAGAVEAGASVERLASPHPELPVSEINRLLYRDRKDVDGLRRALEASQLAEPVRELFQRRLDGALEDFDIRLYGADELLTNVTDRTDAR